MTHPRDRFITVYGRKPALEALGDRRVEIDKLLIVRGARGEPIDRIVAMARERGIKPLWKSSREVTRLSRNGRQDQGVALDVIAPRMCALEAFLDGDPGTAQVVVLDGITTPANVGLIIRAVTAAGLDGIVVPRVGCPEVGPLVVKASAGIALRAPILRAKRADEAIDALLDAGFITVGLAGEAAHSLHDAPLEPRMAWVLGSESVGMSEGVRARLDRTVHIPMSGDVESLNVATAGAVVAFEIQRRMAMSAN